MIKTEAVRYIEYPGKPVLIERLWVPDRGDSDLDVPEWRIDNEATESSVSDFSALQGGKTWPFPESAT